MQMFLTQKLPFLYLMMMVLLPITLLGIAGVLAYTIEKDIRPRQMVSDAYYYTATSLIAMILGAFSVYTGGVWLIASMLLAVVQLAAAMLYFEAIGKSWKSAYLPDHDELAQPIIFEKEGPVDTYVRHHHR